MQRMPKTESATPSLADPPAQRQEMAPLDAFLPRMPARVREMVAYLLASALAFAVDFGLLALLVGGAGLHYLLATTLSFLLGGLVLYVLCVRFVFRIRRMPGSRLELPVFVALGIAGLIVQALLMSAGVELLGIHYLAAKFLAAGGSLLCNFLLRRALLFSHARRADSGSDA